MIVLACGTESEANRNPPDPMLQDSLGLTLDDHVHRLLLASVE
jgi:hypothetical protein